jgi:sortase B
MKQNDKNYCKFIVWLILALSILAMAITGTNIFNIQKTYAIGDRSYTHLKGYVRPGGIPVFDDWLITTGFTDGARTGAGIKVPDMLIDFEALQEINPNAVAWLYSPDTMIDYPVIQAADYNYYLHRLPDGTYNANGSLFIDYNWDSFEDRLTVVYGHNMKNGKMFGSLVNYKKQDYFEAHPYLYLYTADSGNYRIDLMYGCVIGAGQWRDRAFMFDVNLNEFLTYAAHNATFASEAQYAQGDKVIALSTCSYEFDDARYVVVGILREAGHSAKTKTYSY